MDIKDLGQDRFLRKDPNQNDQTKGAAYTAVNPAPKRGDDLLRKVGRPKGSEEDHGAPNILTGTVIVSCFIQTTALPYRIELQGNDLTFFDNTYAQNGRVEGDSSRLVFTHGSAKEGDRIDSGFIFEKRASIFNTYDNVLSIYALPATQGAHNYIFIGRDAYLSSAEPNVSLLNFNVNHDPNFEPVEGNRFVNGTYIFNYSDDGEQKLGGVLVMGNSDSLFPGIGINGHTSLIIAGEGGLSGISYMTPTTPPQLKPMVYAINSTLIAFGGDFLPDENGVFDIGSPSFKIGTVYGSVVACPLPTVDNALEILGRIPSPAFVGERGHYGEDKKYFDDLTFPSELLFTDKKGRTDIEHNHLLGFLLKAVIELKAQVDLLQSQR